MNTVDAAKGHWFEILSTLGIDKSFLRNRHGPCPICAGRDRFRWDDKDGSGSYYCNQCGPGNGMLLLRKLNGWDFATAAAAVDKIIGREYVSSQRKVRSKPPSPQANAKQLLAKATNPEIVTEYLRGRGLSAVPSVLRGHSSLPYYQDRKRIGNYPAMLAPVKRADGRLCGVHRTYLADVAPRKKLIKAGDTVRGGAVRLCEHAGVIGIAEGIETAIAAHELFRLPVWAALSTSGMESFDVPLGVVKVIVLADHDRNFAGHEAAYTLAHRLAIAGIGAEVKVPPVVGDWNDVLRAQRDTDAG
jgi:putative DNA primase/helicase